MMVRDLGGGTDGWTLMLAPSPPHDPQWLDLIAAPASPPSGSAWTRQPGRRKTPRRRPAR